VDTFTHALVTGLILYPVGRKDLIIWGVIGGIILDLDVILLPFSDPYPSLFIFSHGGITHSLIGAAIISVGVFILFRRILCGALVQDRLFSRLPVLREYIPGIAPSYALLAVAAGAFLHLGLDCCLSPGLPLLYPLSLQKYTLGMLSGSSMILLLGSLVFTGLLIFQKITPRHLKVYAVLFLAVLLFSAGMKVYVEGTSEGRTIPTLNPFSWLVIEESSSTYRFQEYDVFGGITNEMIFEKFRNVTTEESEEYTILPEIQRLEYFSYLVIVEKNSTTITFHDPLREEQIIWYPPYYTTVVLPQTTT
jgi:inner membrane protein